MLRDRSTCCWPAPRARSAPASPALGVETVEADPDDEAEVAAGVPRFIPSDFALDFNRTRPGENRNLDLRRDSHTILDGAPVRATSVLNGGFTDLIVGGGALHPVPDQASAAFRRRRRARRLHHHGRHAGLHGARRARRGSAADLTHLRRGDEPARLVADRKRYAA